MAANNDDWPSVGILVGDDGQNNGVRLSLFTGWKGTGSEQWVKHYDLQFSEPPVVPEIKLAQKSGVETAAGAELKLVRRGTRFTLYINDEEFYSAQSDALSGAGFAGFYANGATATFSDFQYEAN